MSRSVPRVPVRPRTSGYLGRSDAFDQSAAAFARTYADVTEADYKRYCAEVPA